MAAYIAGGSGSGETHVEKVMPAKKAVKVVKPKPKKAAK